MKHDKYTLSLSIHSNILQLTILRAVCRSFRFYTRIRCRLCPIDTERKHRRPDFEKPKYNKIYNVLANHWDQSAPGLDPQTDHSMGIDKVAELLWSQSEKGRMRYDEARALIKMFEKEIGWFDFAPGILNTLHNNRQITRWLNRRAAANIIDAWYRERKTRPQTLASLKKTIDAAYVEFRSHQRVAALIK